MMDIDWAEAEDAVYRNICRSLQAFAAAHSDEQFYGLFLDCNATYFELLVHLNTEELLQHQVAVYQQNYPALYRDMPAEAIAAELRWSGGDWGYFEAFRADGHDEKYDQLIRELIQMFTFDRHGVDSEVYDQFLDMACRVAVRLEHSDALDVLRRTPNFRVLCADHDESIEDGERRLNRIRTAAKEA